MKSSAATVAKKSFPSNGNEKSSAEATTSNKKALRRIVVDSVEQGLKDTESLATDPVIKVFKDTKSAVTHLFRPANRAESLEQQREMVVPEDYVLQSMEIVLQKRLSGVTLQAIYETCWAETTPFYEPWLLDDGKLSVQVEGWELGEVQSDWDHEIYSQRRVVTYKYTRDPKTLGYKLGKPEVCVTQTHYYRLGPDKQKSVLSMTMAMDGEPCSDSFSLQIRGVATQASEHDDVTIEFGVFCLFTKQCLIGSQIRDISVQATKESMESLFECIKRACGATEVERPIEHAEVAEEEVSGPCELLCKEPTCLFASCFSMLQPKTIYKDDIDRTLDEIWQKLRLVLALPAGSGGREEQEYFRTEFSSIQHALDSILIRDRHILSSAEPEDQQSVVQPKFPLLKHFRKAMRPGTHSSEWLLRKLAAPSSKRSDAAEDAVLSGMNVVIREKMRGSVRDFYDVMSVKSCWTKWLVDSGKQDVNVGSWTNSKKGFVETWSSERYPRKRKVTYQSQIPKDILKEQTHVNVTQTNYCRMDGDDKFVFAIDTGSEGVWLSAYINIQIRWVVTQVSEEKISVKVGTFCIIRMHTAMARKIRAEATKAITKSQVHLLNEVKASLGHAHASVDEKVVLIGAETGTSQGPLAKCLPCWGQSGLQIYPGSLIAADAVLVDQVKLMERKLRKIETILDDRKISDDTQDFNFYLLELEVVLAALDNIVQYS